MFLSFPECQCVAIFKNRQEKKNLAEKARRKQSGAGQPGRQG